MEMFWSETQKIRHKVLRYIHEGLVGVDIGCGTDKILRTSIGIDERALVGIVDMVADVTSLSLIGDASFEYVYSSHCLEHLEDTKAVLIEWLRILKPDGYFILYLPHRDYYKELNPWHKHNFVEEDITSLLRELGCTLVECSLDVYAPIPGEHPTSARYSFFIVAVKH